jgi:hypothetical protein
MLPSSSHYGCVGIIDGRNIKVQKLSSRYWHDINAKLHGNLLFSSKLLRQDLMP